MKPRILLLLAVTAFTSAAFAQNAKKQVTAYAITAPDKGQTGWTEVRLVDIATGEVLETVYQKTQDIEILNARTGKPVVKKDEAIKEKNATTALAELKTLSPISVTLNGQSFESKSITTKDGQQVIIIKSTGDGSNNNVITYRRTMSKASYDAPFATNSAACAYDKKHDRLYYTPMGINQLRYIDMKSKTTKIYYFEDEAFGVLSNPGDVPNQITRMVIGSDGDGYALTNNAAHLVKLTTGKNARITHLGKVADEAANGNYKIKAASGYGGDMVADAQGNLYLVTANRRVFKINIETKVATYQGSIQGLPKGFSTNGAVVEEGSKVIVTSSTSTDGYYRFDLTTMQAEKASSGTSVYNASDLANGNLAFEKEKKEKKQPEEKKDDVVKVPEETSVEAAAARERAVQSAKINVYPNPVRAGSSVRLSFADYAAGKYQVQLIDVAGKMISSNDIVISNKSQVEELRLPDGLSKGNYIVKVLSKATNSFITSPLVVIE